MGIQTCKRGLARLQTKEYQILKIRVLILPVVAGKVEEEGAAKSSRQLRAAASLAVGERFCLKLKLSEITSHTSLHGLVRLVLNRNFSRQKNKEQRAQL